MTPTGFVLPRPRPRPQSGSYGLPTPGMPDRWGGPYCPPAICPRSAFLACAVLQEQAWRRVLAAGISSVCQQEALGIAPPWVEMPKDGRVFNRVAAIALPAAENVETDLIDYVVPVGWDGVLITITTAFSGTGFIEGSGSLVWRLRRDRYFVSDYGNVTTTLGSLASPYDLEGAGVRAVSQQRLRLTVTVGTGGLGVLGPTGRIIGKLSGWVYPRR